MAKILLHIDSTADFGDLDLNRACLTSARSIERRPRKTIIGLAFISTIGLLSIGLYAADQAIFNHEQAQPAALPNLPLDYE